MALNFPGPGEIRIFYDVISNNVTLHHVQKLSCVVDGGAPAVGTPFSSIDLQLRDLSLIAADTAVDNWVLDMKALLNSAGGNVINRAELWYYDEGTFDAIFISSYDVNVAGTSATVVNAGGQAIVTMRTSLGGIFKLSFMETVIPQAATDTGTLANAALESLVSDIEDGLYPWVGRDGGAPIVRIAMYPGQNEAVWRKRFRG